MSSSLKQINKNASKEISSLNKEIKKQRETSEITNNSSSFSNGYYTKKTSQPQGKLTIDRRKYYKSSTVTDVNLFNTFLSNSKAITDAEIEELDEVGDFINHTTSLPQNKTINNYSLNQLMEKNNESKLNVSQKNLNSSKHSKIPNMKNSFFKPFIRGIAAQKKIKTGFVIENRKMKMIDFETESTQPGGDILEANDINLTESLCNNGNDSLKKMFENKVSLIVQKKNMPGESVKQIFGKKLHSLEQSRNKNDVQDSLMDLKNIIMLDAEDNIS